MTGRGGPLRRIDDHHHSEYWEEAQQHRFEDRLAEEIRGIKAEVKGLNTRLTMLFGALMLLAFILPIAAPFIRGIISI